MKISSLIDVIEGELINSPFVSYIYNIKINAKKVNEGDLFIAKNDNDLSLAIQNGAFAIIYDFDTPILDKEIAWIKVKSYKEALIKIFRYKLSNIDLKAYTCDQITYELLNLYKNKSFKFISSSLENSIKMIENVKDNDIVFCTDESLLNKIYPKNEIFNKKHHEINNICEHSLFETSFSYENKFFSRLKISSIYLNQFLDVYNFCKEDFDFSKLKAFSFMKPLFIDKKCNICEYGKSDRFIITQKNSFLINHELNEINKKFKYAKTIYVSNKFIENFQYKQYVISNIKNLQKFLITKEFNCLYLIGYDFAKVEKTLTKPEVLNSLF